MPSRPLFRPARRLMWRQRKDLAALLRPEADTIRDRRTHEAVHRPGFKPDPHSRAIGWFIAQPFDENFATGFNEELPVPVCEKPGPV